MPSSQPSRILLINAGSGPGGPVAFLCYLLSHLDRSKFEPEVLFYFADRGPHVDRLRSLGVPVWFASSHEFPSSYAPLRFLLTSSRFRLVGFVKDALAHLLHFWITQAPLIWSIVRLLKKRRISLVVLNNDVHYHVAGTLAARLAGIPCICRKAGGIGEGKQIKRFLTPLVDLFVCISQATEKDQRENNPASKRVTTIYEGVDLARFCQNGKTTAPPGDLQLPHGKKVVGLVSRYEPGKGHIETLEAAAMVVKQYPNVIFLIVGGGDSPKARALERDVREAVRRLHLDEFVILTGWRDDIPEVLAAMDVLVHCPTTWIEGLGIANLEAMAMGKPTIVSRNGGLPEVVVDRVTGYVVSPGDVPQLAHAILRLLCDEDAARTFGRNARKRVETHFDMAANTRKLEALFEEYSGARGGEGAKNGVHHGSS